MSLRLPVCSAAERLISLASYCSARNDLHLRGVWTADSVLAGSCAWATDVGAKVPASNTGQKQGLDVRQSVALRAAPGFSWTGDCRAHELFALALAILLAWLTA